MANGEKNEFKRRGSSRRRRTLQDDEKLVIPKEGVSAFWNNWGKNLVQTLFFGAAIILICFVGQEPPGLRTMGEVAPENV